MMNQYAHRIQEHWQKYAPSRYEELGNDKETYFEELGERIADEIQQTQDQIAAQAPTKENYVEQVAQTQAFRRQAEELVMHDYLVVPETTGLDRLEELLHLDMPRIESIEERIDEIHTQAQEAQEEGLQTGLTLDQEEELQLLQEAKTLMTAPIPSDPVAVQERILRLEQLNLEMGNKPY